MPGQCMVEIDQVDLPAAASVRHAGVHSLALRLPDVAAAQLLASGWRSVGDAGQRGWIGPAGEHVQLLA